MSPEILGALGFVITLALAINAYFIRELVESINQVKVQTATLLEKALNSEDEISLLREKHHRLANDVSAKLMAIEIKLIELKK